MAEFGNNFVAMNLRMEINARNVGAEKIGCLDKPV
jgi:hypothetical protein